MTATQRPIKVLHGSPYKPYNLLMNHSIACLNFNHMLITLSGLLIGFAVVFGSVTPLFADYTLILKNGRTITVEAYKEEGGMIIFSSYGGEIGIAREEVESIIPAVEGMGTSRTLPPVEEAPGEAAKAGPGEEQVARPGKEQAIEDKKEEPLATKEKVLTPQEIKAAERAEEEKEYQRRIVQLTHQIKALEDSYAKARRGGQKGGNTAGVCITNCEEFTKAQAADLNSRLKDRLHDPARARGSAIVKTKTRSPFAGAPPRISEFRASEIKPAPRVSVPLPPYTKKEWKFSKLKRNIGRLHEKRDRLIQEMRDRNFNTSSLFLQ